jgi:predicted nucleic acid-binding Zn ribbon protein
VTSDDPRPLSESLDVVLRSLRGAPRKAVAGVFGDWEDIVGAQVASHARPVRLEGERLLVEVDEPGWATQLRFLEAELLARIEEVTGTRLSAIDVRVSPSRDTRRW